MVDNDLTPSEAVQIYVSQREPELRESSVKTLLSRLGLFVDWCENNGIDHLNELSGMDIRRYRAKTASGVAPRTLASRLSDLRVFLRWARDVDIVAPELPERISIPDKDQTRDRYLKETDAEEILEYCQTFRYGSRIHVIMLLFWRTSARLGAIRGLDVEDINLRENRLNFCHRPPETPLKNGDRGERPVAINEEMTTVLDDYLEYERIRVTENDRRPLVTTTNGRISKITLRRQVYQMTRPCIYTSECPHDRDIDECEARERDGASKCPSSLSPHDIRRGSITHLRREDIPKTVVSDRCDVSPEVLDNHYDQMTEEEKMEQRRSYLSEI